jgi:hypothetical protein
MVSAAAAATHDTTATYFASTMLRRRTGRTRNSAKTPRVRSWMMPTDSMAAAIVLLMTDTSSVEKTARGISPWRSGCSACTTRVTTGMPIPSTSMTRDFRNPRNSSA